MGIRRLLGVSVFIIHRSDHILFCEEDGSKQVGHEVTLEKRRLLADWTVICFGQFVRNFALALNKTIDEGRIIF